MSNCHVCFHYKGSPACVAVKATGEHCPAEPVTDAATMSSAEKALRLEECDSHEDLARYWYQEAHIARARVKELEGANLKEETGDERG